MTRKVQGNQWYAATLTIGPRRHVLATTPAKTQFTEVDILSPDEALVFLQATSLASNFGTSGLPMRRLLFRNVPTCRYPMARSVPTILISTLTRLSFRLLSWKTLTKLERRHRSYKTRFAESKILS